MTEARTAEPVIAGIYGILLTPFRAGTLEIDRDSLAVEAQFCLDAGVDGVVVNGVASEFYTLSDAERRETLEVVAEAVDGSVPLVVGVSATHWREASSLASHARDLGAVAVMSMGPYTHQRFLPSLAELVTFYEAIAREGGLPVVLQNPGGAPGFPVSIDQIVEIVHRVPAIRWVKEEGFPAPQRVRQLTTRLASSGVGLIGGAGGLHILSEWRRGAKAWMPACHYVDVLVEVHRLLLQGNEPEASRKHQALLPALLLEQLLLPAYAKRVLLLRGLLSSEAVRAPMCRLDEDDEAER
jgi:4-hydroxy-tetrahydrodipicolinate synthase